MMAITLTDTRELHWWVQDSIPVDDPSEVRSIQADGDELTLVNAALARPDLHAPRIQTFDHPEDIVAIVCSMGLRV